MEYEEIITELSAMTEWNNFAASLVMQYKSKGDLSQKQWDAAERTILNVQAKALFRKEMSRTVDVSRIKDLLETAKVKKPKKSLQNVSWNGKERQQRRRETRVPPTTKKA